jgi:Ni,Fe-hydrogenase I large subunit
MPIEGEIVVRLAHAAGRIARVSIRSTRPLATARVVVGRRAADAAALVPRLYSVCARAQGAASASALESAAGRPPSPARIAARAFAVALENLQEDLRRLLIDVPKAIGQAAMVDPVAEVRRAFAPVLSVASGSTDAGGASAPVERHAIDTAIDVVSRHVLGESLASFAARMVADGLERWSHEATTAPARALRAVLERGGRLGESDVPTLPPMTREQVATMLAALAADAGFAAAPRLDGATRETGALARMAAHPAVAGFVSRHGRGVAARLAARVADVARTVDALADGSTPARVDAWSTASGAGVAIVETARGLLLHCAETRDERVTGYGIVAPTEWNFQPGGPLERSLAGLDARDLQALPRDAGLVVQSLDPCVACSVEVSDA